MSKRYGTAIAVMLLALCAAAYAGERELVHQTKPIYPEIAKRTNLQGTVTLKVMVGPDGRVRSAVPVSGNPILSQAAVTAVKQWVYAPGSEENLTVDLRFSSGQ